MPKANELKKGGVVEFKNQTCLIKNIEVQNPHSRGGATLYKIRFQTVPGRQKLEESFKGDEQLQAIELLRRQIVFSYREEDTYYFMDEESFDQYPIDADTLDTDALYISESLKGTMGLLVDGQLIAIELPSSVEMTVTETSPGIKGGRASARTKPARFATGLVIQVPEYLEQGETVKINTAENRFISRA